MGNFEHHCNDFGEVLTFGQALHLSGYVNVKEGLEVTRFVQGREFVILTSGFLLTSRRHLNAQVSGIRGNFCHRTILKSCVSCHHSFVKFAAVAGGPL